ncbi:MAG: energy transducer TonB [Gammaproteobacteria bacterium]|nr:energy transducer TonB [Gammaproteobacteria bacterium]MDP2348284.1 energy transducer TonB [Gammaproteobacteria bacterium]
MHSDAINVVPLLSLRSMFLIVLINLGIMCNVMAGIPEFNAAMRVGDYQAAATETGSSWESYDKTRESAVTIVREFAFVNYLAGEFATAREFIGNLTNEQSALATRDDQPATTRLLEALINYRLDSSSENRQSLVHSVEARMTVDGVDNISLLAVEELYNDDWMQGRLSEVELTAALAVVLFDRTQGQTLSQKRRAQIVALAAEFMLRRDYRQYNAFVDLHNEIVSDVDATSDISQREHLIPLKWVAHAWINSIWAYLESGYRQTGSNIDGRLRQGELARSFSSAFYESNVDPTDTRTLCEVRFSDGNLRYPVSTRYKGLVGSVIVKVDFDEDGRASNPIILAAIPDVTFSESVLGAVPGFRLRAVRGQHRNLCRMQRKDQVLPFLFLIR